MFGLYPAPCEPTQSMIPSPRTYSPTDHGPPSQGPRPGVSQNHPLQTILHNGSR